LLGRTAGRARVAARARAAGAARRGCATGAVFAAPAAGAALGTTGAAGRGRAAVATAARGAVSSAAARGVAPSSIATAGGAGAASCAGAAGGAGAASCAGASGGADAAGPALAGGSARAAAVTTCQRGRGQQRDEDAGDSHQILLERPESRRPPGILSIDRSCVRACAKPSVGGGIRAGPAGPEALVADGALGAAVVAAHPGAAGQCGRPAALRAAHGRKRGVVAGVDAVGAGGRGRLRAGGLTASVHAGGEEIAGAGTAGAAGVTGG